MQLLMCRLNESNQLFFISFTNCTLHATILLYFTNAVLIVSNSVPLGTMWAVWIATPENADAMLPKKLLFYK